ncbi:putative Csl4p [Leptomonas seymouri]|uniref:Putative Csl4p n=1 Tax=Leptomonas seymouri TaxID=5684 RepID=A0A0N1PEJ0_LEPSE|nr:putative Csl4p [Leptomonas seymouri]|eukprot:KPI87135.1 putative Csl4p [Leptomonas seymouri]
MPTVVHTGSRVAPGDTLFISAATVTSPHGSAATVALGDEATGESEVIPGEGCVVQYVEEPADTPAGAPRGGATSRVCRCIVATRQGIAQWDGRLVSIFAATNSTTPGAAYNAPQRQVGASRETDSSGGPASSCASVPASTAAVMGPRPGDTVHLRVTRLNRLFAFGEIMAVNWRWCSHRGSSTAGISGAFKGVLRQEDIRPFRPTKDQLQPPAPALSFALGDVVLAEVISQSDAHQYQLSTVGEGFGVVESVVSSSEEQYSGRERIKLQHIPGRRDAMMVPSTGGVIPRWCPLLP